MIIAVITRRRKISSVDRSIFLASQLSTMRVGRATEITLVSHDSRCNGSAEGICQLTCALLRGKSTSSSRAFLLITVTGAVLRDFRYLGTRGQSTSAEPSNFRFYRFYNSGKIGITCSWRYFQGLLRLSRDTGDSINCTGN